jgi:hypothetical protein
MKLLKTISFVATLLIIMFACDLASAANYTWKDGYWWSDGVAYNRVKVQYCGARCGWYYRYDRANTGGYGKKNASYGGTEQWRLQHGEILKQHLAAQDAMAASANEQAEYMQSLEAVLSKIQTHGYSPALASNVYNMNAAQLQQAQQQYNYNPYAQQGSTVYGYTETAKAYTDMDLNLLLNQANNHTRNAQELGGQATSEFKTMVNDIIQGQERIAEISARAQAASRVLASTAPQNRVETTKTWSLTERDPDGKIIKSQAVDAPKSSGGATNRQQALFKVLANRCVSCHGGTNDAGQKVLKAGMDLTQYLNFDETKKKKVRDSILWHGDDESKHMPRNPDGTKGQRMPFADIVLFDQ